MNKFFPLIFTVLLQSCTYAPRSTNIDNTYNARQIAVGLGDHGKEGITSTTHEDEITSDTNMLKPQPQRSIENLRDKPLPQIGRNQPLTPTTTPVNNYFTIGSSKIDVINIQGTPSRIHRNEYFSQENWYYDYDSINLR